MKQFIAREKMSKKARREFDSARRVVWEISPVTRRAADKTKYDRKRKSRADEGTGLSLSKNDVFRQRNAGFVNLRFMANPASKSEAACGRACRPPAAFFRGLRPPKTPGRGFMKHSPAMLLLF